MDENNVIELVPRKSKPLSMFRTIPQYDITDDIVSRSIAFQIERLKQIALINYSDVAPVHGDVFDLLHELGQILDKSELPIYNLNAVTVKTLASDARNVIVYLNVTPRTRTKELNGSLESIDNISSLQLQVELVRGVLKKGRTGQVLGWTKVDVEMRDDAALQAMHYRQIIDNVSNMLFVAGGYSDIVDGMYVGYMPYSDTRSTCVTFKGDLPFMGTDWDKVES